MFNHSFPSSLPLKQKQIKKNRFKRKEFLRPNFHRDSKTFLLHSRNGKNVKKFNLILTGELPTKDSPDSLKQAKTGTPEPSNLPMVRKKERDYMGMFEYRREDEAIIVRRLIYGTHTII